MSRPSKDVYFMRIAQLVASRHTCPKRAVGSVIVDKDARILSTGYNGTPKSLPHCTEVPCGGEGGGICLATHAEISALLACRNIYAAQTIYITCSPCPDCMKAILATPIRKIIFGEIHKTWGIARTLWPYSWEFLDLEDI